jgi:glycosyltransferase involved in cell wall biosynthesis
MMIPRGRNSEAMTDALRIVLVSKVHPNPYVQLLYEGLSTSQHSLAVSIESNFSLSWVLRHRGRVDLLHLHWLELLYDDPHLSLRMTRALSVLAGVAAARLSGIRVVYTVHNLAQHEERHRRLNQSSERFVLRLADAVHVHDQMAAWEVAHQYGRRHSVYIAPHGHYKSWYPNNITRDEARRQLGLSPDAFVFLSLGLIRPYKGLETLLNAFATQDDPRLRLLIAGHVAEPAYMEGISRQAQQDKRVMLHTEYVPDEKVQVYCHAADVFVLPYHRVTTSGAALLAFSFDLPIVAPDRPPFRALLAHGRGMAYNPDQTDGLAKALREARQTDIERARQAVRAYTHELAWPDVAAIHANMYQKLLERRKD